jgi:hypothetical protein
MPSSFRRLEGMMVCMGFHDRAWNAAADEYGRSRAEKYGAVARFIRAVQVCMVIALLIGIGVLWASR